MHKDDAKQRRSPCKSSPSIKYSEPFLVKTFDLPPNRQGPTGEIWMAISGKVYDITRYISYHPGGREEILRGAGSDATALYMQVIALSSLHGKDPPLGQSGQIFGQVFHWVSGDSFAQLFGSSRGPHKKHRS